MTMTTTIPQAAPRGLASLSRTSSSGRAARTARLGGLSRVPCRARAAATWPGSPGAAARA
jgi:hypothetical protein